MLDDNSSCLEKNPSSIFQITTKVLYGCIRGFNGRISNYKLSIHAKCFNKCKNWMIVLEKLEIEEIKAFAMVQ